MSVCAVSERDVDFQVVLAIAEQDPLLLVRRTRKRTVLVIVIVLDG